MTPYDKSKQAQLKYAFPGSEKIEKNYAQSYQDMFVLSMLNGKKNGTFVEIGAFDAVFISNTYLLESEFGWTGLAIDIEKSSKKTFKKRGRKTDFIVQDALTIDYETAFKKSGFGSQIDYLQLDIEPQSNTLNCLKILPLDNYRFSVITYETDFYDPSVSREASLKNREESRSILKSHGYELIVGNVANTSTEDPFEDWYIDPKVIDPKIVAMFKGPAELNLPAEKYMLSRQA